MSEILFPKVGSNDPLRMAGFRETIEPAIVLLSGIQPAYSISTSKNFVAIFLKLSKLFFAALMTPPRQVGIAKENESELACLFLPSPPVVAANGDTEQGRIRPLRVAASSEVGAEKLL